MFPELRTFQVQDPKFAAAAVALGFQCRADLMLHVPSGSSTHNTLHRTWHLLQSPEAHPRDLYAALQNGNLAKEQPSHPIFACLAAIESYETLKTAVAQPMGISLVPYLAAQFLEGAQRICCLRPGKVNDNNLNPPLQPVARRECPMDPHFAAVAAVCGFAFHGFYPRPDGKFRLLVGPSLVFEGLTLQHLCQSFVAAEEQSQAANRNRSALNPQGNVELSFQLPGALPGEHPAQYAHAAILTYLAYTGSRANQAGTILFTNRFSALVPSVLDSAEQDQTARFLTQGGQIFQ